MQRNQNLEHTNRRAKQWTGPADDSSLITFSCRQIQSDLKRIVPTRRLCQPNVWRKLASSQKLLDSPSSPGNAWGVACLAGTALVGLGSAQPRAASQQPDLHTTRRRPRTTACGDLNVTHSNAEPMRLVEMHAPSTSTVQLPRVNALRPHVAAATPCPRPLAPPGVNIRWPRCSTAAPHTPTPPAGLRAQTSARRAP